MSATVSARQIFEFAAGQGWSLFVSPWVMCEVRDNLAGKSSEFTFEWPLVFDVTKDKPVR